MPKSCSIKNVTLLISENKCESTRFFNSLWYSMSFSEFFSFVVLLVLVVY